VRGAIERLDTEVGQIRAIHDRIYSELDVEVADRRALETLVGGFAQHAELVRQIDVLTRQIETTEQRIGEPRHANLLQLDHRALEQAREEAARLAAGLDDLRNAIAEIRSEVKHAGDRHDLEHALADRDAASHELARVRDEVLAAGAGAFLVGEVQSEHESHQMPKVLDRARDLFSAFTHYAYELKVPGDESASFLAVESRTGIGRHPGELSDGTRAQLILAARLAFAEEVEGETTLPIFLDEALDHSDPGRFEAIAQSLGRMVEDQGRQIFYFTNDPTDAERIQQALAREGCAAAETIDLAAIRKRASSVGAAAELEIIPRDAVPPPAQLTAEAYGELLGVPPLDPGAAADSQHLFHLLWDDLGVLHTLLDNRIERVGQWRLLARSGATLAKQCEQRLSGDREAGQLEARAQLLDEFCRARAEGRERPVDRAAIESSRAISETFLDRVVDLADELSGNVGRLLEELGRSSGQLDERLKGMRNRADATASLEQYMVETGYLDHGRTLAEADIVARLLASPAVGLVPDGFTARAAHRWWQLSERSGGTR
jgi:hypothetical protein